MSYYTLKDSYNQVDYNEQVRSDNYPFYNRWRNNPLSDESTIRANVAGYYPYKQNFQEIPKITQKETLAIYPNSLILPKDYPINYTCLLIKSKAPDLIRTNSINTPP
jgi:hypothetical protein